MGAAPRNVEHGRTGPGEWRPLAVSAPHDSSTARGDRSDRPCEFCCAWTLPLSAPYATHATEPRADLYYAEWLVWHWHVMHHQQGVPLS
jgi:hypothetical protein